MESTKQYISSELRSLLRRGGRSRKGGKGFRGKGRRSRSPRR